MTLDAMLARLIEADYEVTFLPGDHASADRAFEVHLITPGGSVVTAVGATPAAALLAASPLPREAETAPASPLPWTMSADGSTWRAQLPDGRTAVIERLDDGVSFLPKVYESRGDFATGPVCAGLLDAAAWAAEFAAGNASAPAGQ